ncbi:hypothetical protein [Colwellia sp. MEBiC06753]
MLNTLVKWLIIAIIVITVLSVILLGLGYLLAENERKTKAYHANSQQKQLTASSEPQALVKPTSLAPEDTKQLSNETMITHSSVQAKKIKRIILENLVCSDVSQCVATNIGVKALGCVVATNKIGASLLAKQVLPTASAECVTGELQPVLVCQQNICSIN